MADGDSVPVSASRRLHDLDALRAFSMLAVVFIHVMFFVLPPLPEDPWPVHDAYALATPPVWRQALEDAGFGDIAILGFDESDPDATNLLFNSARATLDPARIQANVAAFLGLVDDAETSTGRPGRTTPVGTHHTDGGGGGDPHHQAREFARRVSRTPEQVAQLAALYATTDWQTRPDDEA